MTNPTPSVCCKKCYCAGINKHWCDRKDCPCHTTTTPEKKKPDLNDPETWMPSAPHPVEEWESWVRVLANSENLRDIDLLVAKIKVLLSTEREKASNESAIYWVKEARKHERELVIKGLEGLRVSNEAYKYVEKTKPLEGVTAFGTYRAVRNETIDQAVSALKENLP